MNDKNGNTHRNNNEDLEPNDERTAAATKTTTGWIQAALEHYIETNKPDPIMERQMRAWSLVWSACSSTSSSTTTTTDTSGASCSTTSGQLMWSSDYLRVTIQSECKWHVKEEEEVVINNDNNNNNNNNHHPTRTTTSKHHHHQGSPSLASLDFTCRVVQLDPLVESSPTTTTTTTVQKGMQQRLAHDPEIQRLRRSSTSIRVGGNQTIKTNQTRSVHTKKETDAITTTTTMEEDKDESDGDSRLLCQAQIQCSPNAIDPSSSSSSHTTNNNNNNTLLSPPSMTCLAERVWTNPRALEGVRRAVWGTADSWMDVLDWLTHFLLLVVPFSFAAEGTEPTAKTKTTTRRIESLQRALSHRAHLRLLEDALCDACEQQAEEEMIQDLDLASSHKKARTSTD